MTRIVVLFDGTWSGEDSATSIGLLNARLPRVEGVQQVDYREGVGRASWERWRGGLLGHGLDRQIRKGYEFVARHHRSESDQIFLLGYSRGAFSARSLAGLIARCGIVAPEHATSDELYQHYRDPSGPGLLEFRDGDARPGDDVQRRIAAHGRVARIRFVGAFDTVGSLGIPGPAGALFGRRYAFHNTQLSGLVDHARHAIALDERRAAFVPTLWTSVPIPVPGPGPSTVVRQHWFVGSHANIGGGGVQRGHNLLATIALEWMVTEARAAGLSIEEMPAPAGAALDHIEQSDTTGLFGVVGALVPGQRPRPRRVRETSLGEDLGQGVLQRWQQDPDYRSPLRPMSPGLRQWVRSLLRPNAQA